MFSNRIKKSTERLIKIALLSGRKKSDFEKLYHVRQVLAKGMMKKRKLGNSELEVLQFVAY